MKEFNLKGLSDMDWGSFTPEFSKENEMVHVFNHFISTDEAVERTILFIINRIKWCNTYLHNEFNHTVVIDDLGQNITDKTREHIRDAIKDYTTSFRFASEEK